MENKNYILLLESLEKQGADFDNSQKESPYVLKYEEDQDVINFAYNIIENTNSTLFADPFSRRSEDMLLRACCFYLVECCRKEDWNLLSVAKILRSGINKTVNFPYESESSVLDLLMKNCLPAGLAAQAYACYTDHTFGMFPPSLIVCDCLFRIYSFVPSLLEDKDK